MTVLLFEQLSIDFFLYQADSVIQFSRKPLLLDKGKVSSNKAKDFAEKQYAVFDSERKKTEALQADLEDQKAIEELLKKLPKQSVSYSVINDAITNN